MTLRSKITSIFQREDINFLLTNRVPRRLLTRFMGWFSKIEHPLVFALSIRVWRLFSDLDLSEARKTTFTSLHDCFIRELKENARPIDPNPATMVSPCDAIVGACGRIHGAELFQIKGFPYDLKDLVGTEKLSGHHRDGTYVTLRLTASMYHRFHAPLECQVEEVNYISGDTWNVNPIALRRIERLFCKNERAVIRTRVPASGDVVTLVPVAAILVASIRLHCLDGPLNLRERGAHVIPCAHDYRKGEEMGWFEHGSTIVVLAPRHFSLADNVRSGSTIRMGQPLMLLPDARRRGSSEEDVRHGDHHRLGGQASRKDANDDAA